MSPGLTSGGGGRGGRGGGTGEGTGENKRALKFYILFLGLWLEGSNV